jgi:hypothetical protein
VLIGVLINIPFALWILYLGKHQQGGTIFDLLEAGLGKIICKLIILIYLLINIAVAACMLNMITGTVKSFFLPYTPAYVIIFFIVSICAMFANSEIQTFARFIEILVVTFTVNFFIGYFLSFVKLFKIEYVIPIFDASAIQFAMGVMISAGTAAECLLFLMVMVGLMPQTRSYYLSVAKGLAAWSVVLSAAILIMEGDIGHELLSRVAQAGVTIARVVQIQSFIRGLEVLVLFTYQFLAIAKTTLFIYSCHVSAKKLFHAKKGKLLLVLAALLIFAASAFINSFNTGYYLSVFLGSYVILPFVALVLILASFSAVIKRKRNGETLK